MSVNTKMTAIADEIRTLSETTDPMGLDAMATNLNGANVEVGDQSDLLDQAIAALEGKAAGGGGVSVETCTVDINIINYSSEVVIQYTKLENNVLSFGFVEAAGPFHFEDVVKNTVLFVEKISSVNTVSNATVQGGELYHFCDDVVAIIIKPDDGEDVSIDVDYSTSLEL